MNNILHVHSTFSKDDSTASPDAIVKRAKEIGSKNITLTDHGTLLGIEPFMDAGKKYGVNTIPGVEAYLIDHMIILAKNYKGYQSISYAMRDANTNIIEIKKREYPIMSKEIIERYFTGNENVIATSACIQGPIAKILLSNYKIKEKILKDKKKLKEFENDCKLYDELNSIFKKCTEDIRTLKKEITLNKKYLTPAYENKINKLKKNLEKCSNEEESIRLKDELETAQYVRKNANSIIIEKEKHIEKITTEKNKAKKERDKAKKGRDKYCKLKDKIDGYELNSEEDLYNEAKEKLLYFKSIFPYFYIELQNHGLPQEKYVMPLLVKLARETDTKIIAANDAHMVDNSPESIEARRIVRYNFFKKSQVVQEVDKTLYIKTDEELIEALSKIISQEDAIDAVNNTNILNECNVVFPNEKHYPTLKNSKKQFYAILKKERWKRIQNKEWNNEYEERLKHEVNIIDSMGYIDYHMVVRDFCNIGRILGSVSRVEMKLLPNDFKSIIQWVKDNKLSKGVKGMGVGPGRGSAAGSLVCYLLGITNIDPIKYELYFERFLNPERVTMPDIDTDIRTSLRPFIIKYLKYVYGDRAVCSISTVTTYGPKNAVRMAGRDRASQLYEHLPKPEKDVMKQKYLHNYTDKITDMLDDVKFLSDIKNSIGKILKENKELDLIYKRAMLIEGALSGTGVHAGGVIISDNDNVNDYIPLAWNKEKEVWAAQCDMIKAEEKGLLKMDLLGLGTLDYIADAIYLIKKHYGIDIDMDKIPFESEVFDEIYAKGNTNSVFQFESPGMKEMLKNFKPTCLNDIIILVAMYRPGPMDFIDDVIKVKHKIKPLTYKTPELEPILKDTYGAIVYQEQVMQIFQQLAGYSLGQADLVRRAMSKKKEEKLKKERPAFIYGDPERNIEGCVANGISEEIANELFDVMTDFAKYAFNKSHAAAYAVVSYQTAWLKYHYPLEYLCALFNNKEQKEYEPLIEDCNMYGIKLLKPDINFSSYEFIIENGAIRYGFKGITGIGNMVENVMDTISKKREVKKYNSIQDFLYRNIQEQNGKSKLIDKKIVETFIEAGLFDTFYQNRAKVVEQVDSFYNAINNVTATEDLQKSINRLIINDAYKSVSDNIKKDIECLGTMLSENPLDDYKEEKFYGCIPINEIKESKKISIYGFVISVEEKTSAKGNKYFLLNILGKSGKCKVYVMNRSYDNYKSRIFTYENKVIKITGASNGSIMYGNYITLLNPYTQEYFMHLKTVEDTKKAMAIINNRDKNGYIPVYINCSWLIKNNEFYEAEKPIICKVELNDKEVELLQSKALVIVKR